MTDINRNKETNRFSTMHADKEEKKMTANISRGFRKAAVLCSIAAMLAGCSGTGTVDYDFEDISFATDNPVAVVTAEPSNTPDTKKPVSTPIPDVSPKKDDNSGKKTPAPTPRATQTPDDTKKSSDAENPVEATIGTETNGNTAAQAVTENNQPHETSGTGTSESTNTTVVETEPVKTNSPAPQSSEQSKEDTPAETEDKPSQDQSELASAEKALQAAEDNNTAAQQNVQDKTDALNAALQAQADAQAKFDEANQQTASEGQYDVTLGTLGFFESLKDSDEAGYDAAKAVLDYASSDSVTEGARTNIGADNDATSLENGMKAIRYLEECNEIRERDGLAPLNVSLEMMAIAEANANASSYYEGHWSMSNRSESLASHGWNTAENWAGAYNAFSEDVNHLKGMDPFHGWYDEEKAIYEVGNTSFSQTGHYQNIISSSYTVTGMGIARKGRWNPNTIQDFDFDAGNQKTYTVAEYKELYNNYYQAAMSSKDADDAQAEIDAAKAELDKANQAVADAKSALEEAKADAETAAQALTDAQNTYEEKKQAQNNNQEAIDKAQEDLDASNEALKEAQANDAQTKQDVADAQEALDKAKDEKAALEDELSQLKTKQAELEQKIADAETAVNEAEMNLQEANADAETKAQELVEAENNVQASQQALDELTNNN